MVCVFVEGLNNLGGKCDFMNFMVKKGYRIMKPYEAKMKKYIHSWGCTENKNLDDFKNFLYTSLSVDLFEFCYQQKLK